MVVPELGATSTDQIRLLFWTEGVARDALLTSEVNFDEQTADKSPMPACDIEVRRLFTCPMEPSRGPSNGGLGRLMSVHVPIRADSWGAHVSSRWGT